jgi:diketogulonate reductase-like aldo/keto reductase
MAGATEKATVQDAAIEEIELDDDEMKELDRLAEETRKCGIAWDDLKAELGL